MRVAVLGSGSWGSALAMVVAEKGHRVTLWGRRAELAESIERTRENATYLPGARFPNSLTATNSLSQTLDGAEMIILAVPTHGLREVLRESAPLVRAHVPIVSATKGIENDTLMLVNEVVESEWRWSPSYFSALSGPSFAKEVANKLPTVVVTAAREVPIAREVQKAFFSDGSFRVYVSNDVVGVEMGGALKNVIAIAAGASDGMGFGHNARAALITRGLAEIARLAVKLGGQPLTLAGLAGMGDLVLTCTGELSRNRFVGFELGKGRALETILGEMRQVAEGVRTARSAQALAAREGVPMPIVGEVYKVLYEGKDPKAAVRDLMVREAHFEFD